MKTGRGLGGSKFDNLSGRLGQQQWAMERTLIQVAGLVRREIPIRLAHRIQDLDRVPMMRDMPSVQKVKQIYIESFQELVDSPPIIRTTAEEQAFADLLKELYVKHSNVLVQMARGAYELREAIRSGAVVGQEGTDHDIHFATMPECHAFLDRFYMSRIGIRFLAGQYLAVREQQQPADDDFIGMICLRTSPRDVVRQAADDAKRMCRRQYGRAPLVDITGRLDLTFPFMPSYLHYILLELLKNALRATCETHGNNPLPPVQVIIADGMENEDVVIKIADEGGGIRRSQINKIWSYLFTTADPSIQKGFVGGHDHGDDSPIAGLGYGLPISRSYCRYFGGALDLMSMEGFGTDAFVHLKRLGDSEEPTTI